ncbi:MAG TPA: YrdB family protein [Pseudonocardiaceae bacterium]|nr:YrdB family protein [Pseudonocardiaceae bacterium]
MIGTAWRMGNLGLAFLLELGAVAALCYWGFNTGGSLPIRLTLGIGAPAVAIVLWALFAAPQATFSVPVLAVITKVLVFGGAAVALWQADQRVLAIVFPAVVVANLLVINLGHLTMEAG